MEKLKELENQLYLACYGLPRIGDPVAIWDVIKNQPDILREAVKVRRDKFDESDLVAGLAICDSMLIDYKSVDEEAYKELVETIYKNPDIARLVLDGASNGGYSYLLMTLWNHSLKLTDEQKKFAVEEAMNKIGTTKYDSESAAYSKKLEEMGITDDIVTTIDFDGYVGPIGAKTKNEYMNFIFSSMGREQAHGTAPFDIRYQILRNPNWTREEKSKLIWEFWSSDENYDEFLEQWEWGVVNDEVNYKGKSLPPFDRYELHNEYTYEQLLEYYGDKETTDRIWDEIQFCKEMHRLRPQQWEVESQNRHKKELVQA